MYGIAPISHGHFDAEKVIRFEDPGKVDDTQKVLQNIHRDSEHVAVFCHSEFGGDALSGADGNDKTRNPRQTLRLV